MQTKNVKQLWFVILSVMWLMGPSTLSENSISTQSLVYADLSAPTQSIAPVFEEDDVLYFYQEHVNWQVFLIHLYLDRTNLPVPPWPENGQLSILLNIITHQQYCSLPSLTPYL